MSRHPVLTLLASAAIGLAACAPAEPIAEPIASNDDASPTASPPAASPSATPTAPPTSAPGTDAPSPGPTPAPPTDDPAGDAAVVLVFDGRRVPVAATCAGVDGAILASTPGEVTITAVHEAGLALRLQAEGTTAETSDVTTTEGEGTTTHTATLSSDQVDPIEVAMTIDHAAARSLPSC